MTDKNQDNRQEPRQKIISAQSPLLISLRQNLRVSLFLSAFVAKPYLMLGSLFKQY